MAQDCWRIKYVSNIFTVIKEPKISNDSRGQGFGETQGLSCPLRNACPQGQEDGRVTGL